MFGFIKKIFGTHQSRLLKGYWKIVAQVNRIEETLQSLSDEQVLAKTAEFKQRLSQGESPESLLPEAFAVVKNTCRRLLGTEVHVSGYSQKWDMIPYDVQIVGAIAMFYGSIAEMQTGEGKTLTASMPLYLHALSGKPVHLVTVNDYLAKRDCEWIGSIFRKLGLSVASLTNDVPPAARKEIYQADIVYGTASEFGFDYLRDNSMAMSLREQVQRGHFFAIVDEIDSILIDEARTPLIISGPVPNSRQMYDELKEGVSYLVRIQRDLCNKIALDAKKELDASGIGGEESVKIPKELKAIFQKFWLVGKGTPHNKILKKIKEHPDFRAEIDQWETYYFGDVNKEEKQKALSELYMIVDERGNEFELTDKGILAWSSFQNQEMSDDFVMLDLGHEYHLIEQDASLTEEEKLEEKISLREEDAKRKERAHNLRQLLRAHLLMEKDVDYIVQEGKVVIIDENTGRPQPGRRFSDGLHQAIEAKENLSIQGETQTYATITLQNYFRLYERLAGMTGTAMTEANEFKEIYKLQVMQIPTHLPCRREDAEDEVYMSEREKYLAIIGEVQKIHAEGRPILIGTESVETSEKLSRILKQNRLEHTILNAKNHAREAEIIAEAGNPCAITLATNMAGRGTDIKLKEGMKDLGGLHVIGTTRHNSRRIDRQLRGRCGRLGDPGSSKFFVSFEDPLMRLFASPRMTSLLQRFRPPEGEPISAKVLSKSIETAQKRVEQRNYTIRKHTLEYDDVMNKQRQEVYAFRNALLQEENPLHIAEEMIDMAAHSLCEESQGKDLAFQQNLLLSHFPIQIDPKEPLDEEAIREKAKEAFRKKLVHQREVLLAFREDVDRIEKAQKVLKEVVRNVMLRRVDFLWQEHLLAIDHLRSDVHMRTVGQKDPLLEFKNESFSLFQTLSKQMQRKISQDLFRFEMAPPEPPQKPTPLRPRLVPVSEEPTFEENR